MRWILYVGLCFCVLIAPGGVAEVGGAHAAPVLCPWVDPALRSQELQVTYLVWKHNIIRKYGVVHPSGAYGGVWLRDTFWTLSALGDLKLSNMALRQFAGQQRADGQVPTQFTVFYREPVYHADESTLLFLIWSAWQVQRGGVRPDVQVLRRALAYVRAQATKGLYRSSPGTYTSWFDSFKLPSADTLAYNQGLYATALLAAQALNLQVPSEEVAAAIGGYRSLVDPRLGYLRFSKQLAYHDISGMTGEFLSLWLFHRALLPDKAVGKTLASQPPFKGGFRIVTDAYGRYLSPRAFVVHLFPGDYQNGGSWLLYDYLALGAGYLHHIPGTGQRLHSRLVAEFQAGPTFHEYLATDPHSRLYNHEPPYRDGFSWNTFIVAIDAALGQPCTGT